MPLVSLEAEYIEELGEGQVFLNILGQMIWPEGFITTLLGLK